MRKLINSNTLLGRAFRKSFLKTIKKQIESDKESYCCYVTSWHKLFICWKDLKEVKENMKSTYLIDCVAENEKYQNCEKIWFIAKFNRISFLKECINKIK